MVSWGFAFKKGAIIFLWSIVWTIIYLVFLGIAGIVGFSLILFLEDPIQKLATVIGGFTIVVIGTIIYTILMLATIVKISAESALEEAKKT